MGQERRRFTDEFKTEAVALLASSGRPLVQIASELGISPSMLRNWRHRNAGRNAGSAPHPQPSAGAPTVPDAAAEICRLRRENDRLRMERDILKNFSRGFVPPVAVETGVLAWPRRGGGRLLHGGDDPVKKRGPWAVAHLRVATP